MGTWKLAYADFLTALAAFFLLMWMLNDASPAARVEIAAYFRGDAPARVQPVASAVTFAPAQTKAAEKLYAALTLDETLASAGDSLILTPTPQGVRLELIDRDDAPLFATGASQFTPRGERLVAAVARALVPFDTSLSIEGHTDAFSGDAAIERDFRTGISQPPGRLKRAACSPAPACRRFQSPRFQASPTPVRSSPVNLTLPQTAGSASI